MKKLVAIFGIIILLLTGCAKQIQDPENIIQAGSGTPSASPQQPPVDETLDPVLNDPESQQSAPSSDANPSAIENAPALWGGSVPSFYDFPLALGELHANFRLFSNVTELKDSLSAMKYVIFRGKKENVTKQYVKLYQEPDGVQEYHSETQIRILESYYGLIANNDLLTIKETAAVVPLNGTLTTIGIEKMPPIKNNQEYIFVLATSRLDQEGNPLYTPASGYYAIVETGILSELSEKVQNGSADDWDQFRFDLLSYYLNNPDTRLDLHHEASRYVENLSETASQEEILAALPEEQRTLFTRLIAQYGVK